MQFNRRNFLKSLSRTALVLSFDQIFGAFDLRGQAATTKPEVGKGKEPANPLGVSFVDVAREAGLNAKTIFGGVEKDFAHSNATYGVMKAQAEAKQNVETTAAVPHSTQQ